MIIKVPNYSNSADRWFTNCNRQWHSCRDVINMWNMDHLRVNPAISREALFYRCPVSYFNNTISFVIKFQELCNIKDADKFTIYETNMTNVIYFKLSPFWQDIYRNSLLTAIIRCGEGYDDNNSVLDHINLDLEYCKKYFRNGSLYALKKFIDGYHDIDMSLVANSFYSPAFHGWVDLFAGGTRASGAVALSNETIDSIMKKPNA